MSKKLFIKKNHKWMYIHRIINNLKFNNQKFKHSLRKFIRVLHRMSIKAIKEAWASKIINLTMPNKTGSVVIRSNNQINLIITV